MRYVATLILFALATPCVAQTPYSDALERAAAAWEETADAAEMDAASFRVGIRTASAWGAAGGAMIDEDAANIMWETAAAFRKFAAFELTWRDVTAQSWAAGQFNAREEAAEARQAAALGREAVARAYATEGRYAGLWERAAEAGERGVEVDELAARAWDRAAAAWERAVE